MALVSLSKIVFPLSDMNGTENGTSTLPASIPASILEAFLPGYGGITRFIHQSFGFDVTIFVSAGVVIWLLCQISSYLYTSVYELVAKNYMCSINVKSIDDIYFHLMKWLAAQESIRNSRSLMAETTFVKTWEVEDEEGDGVSVDDDDNDEEINFLNFSNQEAKAPPRFIPHFGSHRFWWKGNLFILARVRQQVVDVGSFGSIKDHETLTLTCFGRSAQPIKNLLQDAKDFSLLDHKEKTVIRRPSTKEMRRYGGQYCWVKIADRPCRPMETVVLDKERKREVLSDINEYLHPATPRWYANRGIPYRRGYLFHGPPGTGKTSLSFALAGVFGLDIYVISLLEPTLTEEDLGQLFNSLPRRCVVLLEDIDTAGLNRPDTPPPAIDTEDETEGSPTDAKISELEVTLVRALKKAKDATEEEQKKGISLSGLLNAIDGVASHEGRVLVMTTNKPEALDDALIRPGRVDLQVPFGNATQEQIEELFIRMYTRVTPIKNQDKVQKTTKSGISLIPFPSILGGVSSSSQPVAASSNKESILNSCNRGKSNGKAEAEKLNGKGLGGIIDQCHCDYLKVLATPPPSSPVKTEEEDSSSLLQTTSPSPITITSSSPPTATISPSSSPIPSTTKRNPKPDSKRKNNFTPEELKTIAASFASKIPDFLVSPAEVQGFLLKRKRDPRRAEEDVGRWVGSMVVLKGGKGKVLDVQ